MLFGMQKGLLFSVLILVLLHTTAFAFEDPRHDPDQGIEQITLQLKWKHQFQFAGYYAALEKRFYHAAGLDVTILEHNGYRSPAQVILDGAADYAITDVDVLIRRAQGEPLVALAAIFQHSPYAFLVRADSGIQRVEDLAGRRVMIGAGSQDAALLATLRRAGLSEGDITRLSSSFDARSLIKGESDAFSAYITDQWYILEQSGVEPRYLMPKEYGIDFYSDILVTSEREVRKRPDRVRRFREATLRGWEYALSHVDEMVELIHEKYNTQGMSRTHLRTEANKSRDLILSLLVRIGYMNPDRWQHIKEVFIELGMLDPASNIDGLIYDEHLTKPQWMSWIERYWIEIVLSIVVSISVVLFLIVMQMRRMIQQRTAELMHSELRYRTVFNAAPEGMWVINAAKKTVDVNEHLMNLLGYAKHEILGRSPLEFADAENRKILIQQIEKIATTERRNYDIALKHKDGRNIQTHISEVTLHSEDNSVLAALAFVEDITERKAMEEELRRSEKNLRTLIDAEPACVKTLDREGRLLNMNAAGLSMIQAGSFDRVRNHRVVELVDEEFRDAFSQLNRSSFSGQSGSLTFSLTGLKGRKVWLETQVVPLYDVNGDVSCALSVTHNITEHRRMEQQVRLEREFLQRVIDSISDAVMVVDTDLKVQLMNQTAKDALSAYEINPADPLDYFDLPYSSNVISHANVQTNWLTDVLESGKRSIAIASYPLSKGAVEIKRVEIIASPLFNEDGSVKGVIEVARDITDHLELLDEVQKQKENLQYLAYHDALTNLPNRTLFIDRLEHSIIKAQRLKGQMAVLFLDLDRFKEINDSLGHAFGDKLLMKVANRFNETIRKDDSIARLGGDEFTFISESLHRPQDAVVMARKLLKSLESPLVVDNHQFFLTASIGISLYPQDGQKAETLLRNADAAMYKAKEEGKNTFQFYTQNMTEQAFERISLEANLRQALNNQELVVYYQVQVNCVTQRVIGVEALVRWQHPEHGLVSPAKFIPLAEDTGLILPLGEQVMQQACEQMQRWDQQGLNPGKLAVNLSVKQISSDQLLTVLRGILKKSACRAEWLELEVTEGFLMKNPEKSIAIMRGIRELGIELAIDDFGIGYSSLAYLKRFPITRLKIDQSFIRDIPEDLDDMAITRAVIALGKNLNLNVVAEGVETEAQKAFLINEGCHEAQGFLYSRPVPAEEMTQMLKEWQFTSQKDLATSG